MKKKLAVFLTIALMLGSLTVKAEVNQATINYLADAEQNAWVTQALVAVGGDNFDLSYLNDFEAQNANDVAKAILALVAAGQNPYDYQSQNYVGWLLNYFQNNQIGSSELLNDDFWGILALRAAGEPVDSAVITAAKSFIIQHQNQDGGWSWAPASPNRGEPASPSDTNDTAAAIMALREAGQGNDSPVIQSAVSYLQDAQNEDGGFPFTNGESDAGSDAWVIIALNKLAINPASWQKNGHNPIEHLQSLMLNDGSFKWLAADAQGSLMMTAYAAVALTGRSYPVAFYQPIQDQDVHHLRIEGRENTICNAQVEGQTAQEVLENGAEVCGYAYHIQNTDWGPYLDKINEEQAEGQNGWLYRINWLSPAVGMADYNLQTGDEVFFYYAFWQAQPLRISLSDGQANSGDEITATVEYFDEQSWQPASPTSVVIDNHQYQTNQSGQATFLAPAEGSYLVYASGDNFVRSPKQVLIVGEGSANSVVLSVDVFGDNQEEEEENEKNAVVFRVSANHLDFGSLRPGSRLSRSLTITNEGGTAIYLEGVVSGDAIFEDNLVLNEQIWENYHVALDSDESAAIDVGLLVPQNYHSGHYSANLVLWGSAR